MRLPKVSIRITFYWCRFAAPKIGGFLVLVKYCRVALIVKVLPDRVCSRECSHSQKCTWFSSSAGRFCTVWSDGDKNINRGKFCTPVSVQNQPDWKFLLTFTLIAAKFKRQIFCSEREIVHSDVKFPYSNVNVDKELFFKRHNLQSLLFSKFM
jgi:hypothetical protein